jgi:hypothetical protein
MPVWITSYRKDVKLPAVERMGRIGHFEAIAGTWVVEGGINIGYRSTAFRTPSL